MLRRPKCSTRPGFTIRRHESSISSKSDEQKDVETSDHHVNPRLMSSRSSVYGILESNGPRTSNGPVFRRGSRVPSLNSDEENIRTPRRGSRRMSLVRDSYYLNRNFSIDENKDADKENNESDNVNLVDVKPLARKRGIGSTIIPQHIGLASRSTSYNRKPFYNRPQTYDPAYFSTYDNNQYEMQSGFHDYHYNPRYNYMLPSTAYEAHQIQPWSYHSFENMPSEEAKYEQYYNYRK